MSRLTILIFIVTIAWFSVWGLIEAEAFKYNACYIDHHKYSESRRELTALMHCMHNEYAQRGQLAMGYMIELQINLCGVAEHIIWAAIQIALSLVFLAWKAVLYILAFPFHLIQSEEFSTVLQQVSNIAALCNRFFFDSFGQFLHMQTQLGYADEEAEAWRTALRLWMELDTLVDQVAGLLVRRV